MYLQTPWFWTTDIGNYLPTYPPTYLPTYLPTYQNIITLSANICNRPSYLPRSLPTKHKYVVRQHLQECTFSIMQCTYLIAATLLKSIILKEKFPLSRLNQLQASNENKYNNNNNNWCTRRQEVNSNRRSRSIDCTKFYWCVQPPHNTWISYNSND